MDYICHLTIVMCVYAVLAMCQNLVYGIGGALLVMQSALLGIGAYAAALAGLRGGVPSMATLVLGAMVTVLFGLLLGLPALRLRGDYLLVASLGLVEIVRSLLHNAESVTGGATGLIGIPPLAIGTLSLAGPRTVAPIALAVLLVSFAVFQLVQASPAGRLLTAIRADTQAVRRLGRSVRKARLMAIGFAAAWAGLIGGIWAHYLGYLDPSSFSVFESTLVLSMVVVGGAGRASGAVVGAAILVLLPEGLRFVALPPSVSGPLRQVFYGIVIIILIRYRPGGLLGTRSRSLVA